MYARSTALAYVVHDVECMDGMERQLGPICSVEAFYAASSSDFWPNRSIVALQEGHAAMNQDPRRGTAEILRQLQQRRVGELPCNAVMMGNRESHRSLLMHIVASLATNFCLSARDGMAVPETKKVVDWLETTDTITPVTGLSITELELGLSTNISSKCSRTSSPKGTPSSSMLSAAHESPGTSANASACVATAVPVAAAAAGDPTGCDGIIQV
jgi:hypothetical protein